MIQPLRTIHRRAFLVFGLLLPVLFVSGVLSRHKWPMAQASAQIAPYGTFLTEQTVVLDGRKVAVDLYADTSDPGSIRFVLQGSLVAPDVLVYWSEASSPSALPADARLLGSFSPTAHYRPLAQGRSGAYLILYSAALQQTLGSFSLARWQ